jgi:hypothetical protein
VDELEHQYCATLSDYFRIFWSFLFLKYSETILWAHLGQDLTLVQVWDPYRVLEGKFCLFAVLWIRVFSHFLTVFIQIIFRDEPMMQLGPVNDPGLGSRPIRSAGQ